MADFRYSAGIDVNLNVKGASGLLQELLKLLLLISTMKIDIGAGNLTADITKASEAAMKLSAHLATAMNPQTGNLDFTKFYASILKSGASLLEYGEALLRMGPVGQKAFVSLADSISKSEIPLKRTSLMVDKMWDGLKRTASWQLLSSIIHGLMGSFQSAIGYAKDLNSSLNDIRIVTGQSSDLMAKFAKEANQAAKNLSTTTTDYTKASLIYYQLGLSDAEVKLRTETTIKMANVSGQSTEKVSSLMTAIWNNYDNGSKSLEYYGDVITALGAKTASSSEEIAQGILKFAAVSDTIGLSYEYAASALATVTATTRESADIVGNAYKTLFSRIQGLNLGETLDDGTTLNKYSAALSKVGISIKDSSGNLKDMDSILSEMGTKWDTLSKDLQTALALTVAGVRQYTLLVALMDNWDTFQLNLLTAKGASGTLDMQAAIYAQSWEAASDRVRASWEGLWDTMVNSDSMITMLDGISGIVDIMDTLATSIGGAGGVLTSFLGIATKLFAPKLSLGLRDTAYNVSMLFGGLEKIKNARNALLDDALKTLDVDGKFGDLYGLNEAEARRAAMKSLVLASLDYAENYSSMTPLLHLIEQLYANATRAQDLKIIEAGAALDNAKNALFDARMDTYGTYGSGGEYSSLLDRSQLLLATLALNYIEDSFLYMEDHGIDWDTPENLAKINNATKRLQYIEASNDIIKTEKTGKVLGDFSSALIDFYKTASGEKGPDYLNKLTGAINKLEKTGYQSESKTGILNRMKEAAKRSAEEGTISDYGKFYSELIRSLGMAAGGTEFGGFLSAWLEQNFKVGMALVDYLTEQNRGEGLRGGREQNLYGTRNIDWADAMVSAGEGAMLALSSGQSLLSLGLAIDLGTADAMTSITSIVSAISSFGMAMASFASIFKGIGALATHATGWGAAIAALITGLPLLFKYLDSKIITEEELAEMEAKTQAELNKAYAQSESRHKDLLSSISTYQEALDALAKLTRGTEEWTSSLYQANKTAMGLIALNNLVEGKDYYRDLSTGLINIFDETLEYIKDTSTEQTQKASTIKDLSQANRQISIDDKKYEENLDSMKDDLSNNVANRVNTTLTEIYKIADKLKGLYSLRNEIEANKKTIRDYLDAIEQAIGVLSENRDAFKPGVEAVLSLLGLENDLILAEELYNMRDRLISAADRKNNFDTLVNDLLENTLKRNASIGKTLGEIESSFQELYEKQYYMDEDEFENAELALYLRLENNSRYYGQIKSFEDLANIDYEDTIKKAIGILSSNKNAFTPGVEAVLQQLGLENNYILAEELYSMTSSLLSYIDSLGDTLLSDLYNNANDRYLSILDNITNDITTLENQRDAYGQLLSAQASANIGYGKIIERAIEILSENRYAFSDAEDILKQLDLGDNSILAEELYGMIDRLLLAADEKKYKDILANENYENLARNFLNEENYKYQDLVFSASGRILRRFAEINKEDSKIKYDESWESIAKDYADMVGLSLDENFKILGQNSDDDVQYLYTDAEGNIKKDGLIGKNTLIEFDAANSSLSELETATNDLDAIFTRLNNTTQDADGALESYIAELDMSKATLQEINALYNAFNNRTALMSPDGPIGVATGLSKDDLIRIADLEGLSLGEWINNLVVSLKLATVDAIPYVDRVKTHLGVQQVRNKNGSISWDWLGKDDLSNFVNGLSIENLKLLDSTLINIKALEGQSGLDNYVNALASLIKSADDVDSNDLVQMLLNLENIGSAASNLEAIQAIITGLGGSFEEVSSAALTFAIALADINTSGLDNILSKFKLAKNALGDVFRLETGGNIGEEAYDNIIKAFPELKELFTEDILNGGYRYMGSLKTARETARNAYLATGENLYLMLDWSKETIKSWTDSEDRTYTMSELGKLIRSEFSRDTIEATLVGDQQETITSEGNSLEVFRALVNGDLGQGALDAVIDLLESIKEAADITATLDTYIRNMNRMNELTDSITSDNNGDGVLDYRDLDAFLQKEYLEAQEAATVAQTILSNIWSLIELLADPEGLEKAAESFENTKGQTAENLNELAEMYNMREGSSLRMATKTGSFGEKGSTIMADSVDMQNYAKNLALIGKLYGYSAELADLLLEAIGSQDWVMAEALMKLTELATAIALTADARGMDAEAIALLAESILKSYTATISDANEINEDLILTGELSAQAIADMAAEMLAASEATTVLKKNAKNLYKDIKGKDAAAANTALRNLETQVKKLIGVEGDAVKGGKKFRDYIKENQDTIEKAANGETDAITELQQVYLDSAVEEGFLNDVEESAQEMGKSDIFEGAKSGIASLGAEIQELQNNGLWNIGEAITQGMSTAGDAILGVVGSLLQLGPAGQAAAAAIGDAMGFDVQYISADALALVNQNYQGVIGIPLPGGAVNFQLGNAAELLESVSGNVMIPTIVPKGSGAGSGDGGGGGGGGGGKEPKKVANKRKSQTVNRYKYNDTRRSYTEKAKKSEENKQDYLYGESKIALMEKINKLAEKEAKITADRIKESRMYLIEDRENLIKYLQKYGYEAEFDANGFLTNYEQVWTDIYELIAALYEDNLLTEDEEKIEEELKVKLEELEGALEDYENSLNELQEDIAAYEETLFEMYDNKVEALEHKVEFKIELSEDDLDYLDFWIESLGDNVYNALEAIEAMGAKANALFDGLETYQLGIIDIMSLSDDPLQVWATGGIRGILTQDQVDALRDNRDGLADYMLQLIDLRDEIKDKVLDTFDDWQEKLDSTLTTIEHYTSVLEHFKNMIDIVGKDSLGLSNQFMANLEQNAINLSLDSIDANKAYYDNLVEILQEAQLKLEDARARGDQSSTDHWEEVVQSTTEAMQDAQDALLTSLEDSLNLIAELFEANMKRAVEAFNDSIYAHGGLKGLSNDYSLIRENADLMAADYEKIYELSKITRNIDKTLDDTKIVAGKLKLISLLKEINSLQNSGVELSKYDLEYLQAKYELRLAEIELENAKNAKDTVRLSRDSEGNWSYIYTLNNEAVAEAELKYEDALYEMLKLSQEYLEEMSSKMLETSSAMMEEISNLRIQDFNSYEEYQAEIKRIQDKYAESLKLQENELNKAVSNSEALYEQDWRNYNLLTGYKISESEKWIDKFRESTIGLLLDSDTVMSSFSDTFLGLTEILTKNLADSAVNYFTNIDKALLVYGTSIDDFGKHVENTTANIGNKSKGAAEEVKSMAVEMNNAFKEIAETVSDWQEEFSSLIDNMLEKIKTLILDINEAIETSAKYLNNNKGVLDLIGLDEAIELINATNKFGSWKRAENGTIEVKKDNESDYVATNFIDFNAELAEAIDKKIAEYTNAKTGSSLREALGAELEKLFLEYWQFRNIIDRVYDPTNIMPSSSSSSNNNNNTNDNNYRYKFPKFTGFDTGGYTGEWGDSGKFAMLHEKELVLNKDDTKNFLEALNISKDVINSMIEMNAKLSSMAFGNLIPSSIQDTSLILEQTVTILAEFPNATNHSEIEEAFNNLINTASQYANRR